MYRLITYNIHSGVGRDGLQDYRRIGQFLTTQKADFVLLQEMDTRPYDRDVNDDISAICADGTFMLIPAPTVTTENGWYGNAILTRHPVLHRQQYDISVPNREPRTLQQIVVGVGDFQMTLLNAHLGLKKAERIYKINKINQIIGSDKQCFDMPICLGGDMNEWWLKTRLFNSLNTKLSEQPTGKSFPSHMPILKLDRLWTSPSINVINASRLQDERYNYFSDHLPIQMDFELCATE